MVMEDEIPERGELVLYGIPASPGVMHGPVFRFLHDKVEVPHYTISNSDKVKDANISFWRVGDGS